MTDTTVNPSGAPGAETTKPGSEARIPVYEEELSVAKRVVERGRVQVSRTTRSYQQAVDELLNHEEVEVEHVAVGQPIDTMPSVRQEGDVTIVPVVEEVLKIERRLVLKEEVHIRRVQRTERYQNTVTLRKQEVVVSRVGSEGPARFSQDRT
jgi:uncharacterized protein (TIGR02271 family)